MTLKKFQTCVAKSLQSLKASHSWYVGQILWDNEVSPRYTVYVLVTSPSVCDSVKKNHFLFTDINPLLVLAHLHREIYTLNTVTL